MPHSATSTPHRTKSCDTASEGNRNSLISEDGPVTSTGISSSSSEHDNQEANAWSSDYSNSEDEFNSVDDPLATVSFFLHYLLWFYFVGVVLLVYGFFPTFE